MIRRLIDSAIERTVIPSFSSIGAGVRKRLFAWQALEGYDLSGQVVVLTGGTSGIGAAAAELYARLGATLVIVARSPEKTTNTVESLRENTGNTHIDHVLADLTDTRAVRAACEQLLGRYPRIDTLAHNAGALFTSRSRTPDGSDLGVELMVSTPFLMTGLLLPSLTAGPRAGRVLTMSSGGMYTEALNVAELEMPDAAYVGAQQYARAKRAQVTLNAIWAEKISATQCVFHALHPGWVNTPGIHEALPGFSRVLGPLKLLRQTREGADTLVWLSADEQALQSTGAFWHDRAIRSPFMTSQSRQADTQVQRQQLWQWCESRTGFTLPESYPESYPDETHAQTDP